MVPSSVDIIIHNRRISQSETSAITNGEIANTYIPAAASRSILLEGDQNVTSPVFQVIVRLPIHFNIILTSE